MLIDADRLFLCTDVDALYTGNPNVQPDAEPIRVVEDVAAALRAAEASQSASGTQWGTGGICTKLRAAQLASAAGITTVIMGAKAPAAIPLLVAGSRDVGTTVLPAPRSVRSHKR